MDNRNTLTAWQNLAKETRLCENITHKSQREAIVLDNEIN